MSNKRHETIIKETKAHLKAVNIEIKTIKKTYNALIRKAKLKSDEMKVFGHDNQYLIKEYKKNMAWDLDELLQIKAAWQATLDVFESPINKKWGK